MLSPNHLLDGKSLWHVAINVATANTSTSTSAKSTITPSAVIYGFEKSPLDNVDVERERATRLARPPERRTQSECRRGTGSSDAGLHRHCRLMKVMIYSTYRTCVSCLTSICRADWCSLFWSHEYKNVMSEALFIGLMNV